MKDNSPQTILLQNIIKGKIAEQIAMKDYQDHGYRIVKTGIGSDFKVIKPEPNFIYQEYVDVKVGKARLTKKQQKMRHHLKRQGIKYSIYHVSNEFLEYQILTNYKHVFNQDNPSIPGQGYRDE